MSLPTPTGGVVLDVAAIRAQAAAAIARRKTRILDGIEGFRIKPYDHGGGVLLLPLNGDPVLDVYYVAQLHRIARYEAAMADVRDRNRALQRARHTERLLRKRR